MAAEDFVQSDFSYDGGQASARPPLSLSIYANRLHLRASLRDDAAAAGLRVLAAGPLQDLLEAHPGSLGDVVMIDCPQVDGRMIAALCELDQQAASGGTRLIVSTTIEALDPVFGCMDQSAPTLLIEPNRAERVLALGRVLAEFPGSRLCELSDDDRVILLRLSEQVGEIATRLDASAPVGGVGRQDAVSAFAFGGSISLGQAHGDRDSGRGVRPPLPDARLVRAIIRQRQLRSRFLDGGLFSDPAWEMLLDLTAARVEQKRVSVSSLCIASGAPPTTALRWIGQMVEAGLFVRVCDDSDRRRAFIELSDRAVDSMARYFSEIALTAPVPV